MAFSQGCLASIFTWGLWWLEAGFGLTQWHFLMVAGGRVGSWHASIYPFHSYIRLKIIPSCPKSLVKGKKWSLHLLCVHFQEAFLFHSLSTNITFPHLLEARFEATRARWHFHMVVVGNWARVTVGVTPPRVLVLVTPPRDVEEVDQAEPPAIGKKRRFGKYGLARKAW